MSGPDESKDPKNRKESMKERLQHDENAWAESQEALYKEIAQMFGYMLRVEKRVTALEIENKILKSNIRKLMGVPRDKKS